MARRTTKQVRKILWAYAKLHGRDALAAYADKTRKRLIRNFLQLAQARQALYRRASSRDPGASTEPMIL